MTIDEAKNLKKVAENTDCIIQLIDTVAKTMIEAFENLKIEDVNMFQLGYNKAIDDLIAECENAKFAESDEISLSDVHTGVNSGLSMAIHFAEQLKAGGENENYNKEES